MNWFARLHFLHRAWRYRLRSEKFGVSFLLSRVLAKKEPLEARPSFPTQPSTPWIKLPAILSALVLLVLVLFPHWVTAEENSPLTGHWSFESPTRHDVPPVKDTTWGSNAVDSFILARIEAAGLTSTPGSAA